MRRVEARRSIANILQSAGAVLAEDPSATITEIAERAGLHRSTLHRHFASRDALIDELVLGVTAAIDEQIANVDVETGNARDALRRATIAWLLEGRNWRVARYAPLGTLPRGDAAARIRARMVGLFERGQREGTIRDEVSPRDLYFAWNAMVIGWGALPVDADEPEHMADAIIAILLPEPSPFVMRIVPYAATPDSPARLMVEADGKVKMQVSLDNWTPHEP
jgi:AcrR family transcriptional regulator